MKAPENEQNICVACGFCCDGTLFLHANLNAGERGNLPEEIEKNSFTEEGKDYFSLPCNYFKGKCIIYNSRRADVCSSYRCQLLKDVAEGITTQQDALETVHSAVKMREELFRLYGRLTGEDRKTDFLYLLKELGKIQKEEPGRWSAEPEFEMLLARCNILEALLIKHIRSAKDFEMMTEEGSGE